MPNMSTEDALRIPNRRRLRQFLTALVVPLALTACKAIFQPHEQRCTHLWADATSAYEAGNYSESVKRFEQAVLEARKSDNAFQMPCLLMNFADAYTKLDQLEKAEQCLDRALEALDDLSARQEHHLELRMTISREKAECLGKLANLYYQEKKIQRSEQLYKQAINLCEGSLGTELLQARIMQGYQQLLKESGREKIAHKLEIDNALTSYTDHDWDSDLSLMQALFEQGRLNDALNKLDVAEHALRVRAPPRKTTLTLYWLAFRELLADNLAQADSDLKMSISKPGHTPFIYIQDLTLWAFVLIRQGRVDEAHAKLNGALHIGGGAPAMAASMLQQAKALEGVNKSLCAQFCRMALNEVPAGVESLQGIKAIQARVCTSDPPKRL